MSQYRGQEAETDAATATESYSEASGPPPAAPPQPPPNEHHPYPYQPPAAPYDAAGAATGHDAFGPRQPFSPAGAKMPPRFNPAISQPPTPTLNQLLQSSSPMNPHRYQNNYPEQHYNQWPAQKGYGPGQPSGPYRPPQPYAGGPPPQGYDSRAGWPGGPPAPGGPHHGPGSPNQSQPPAPPSQGQQPPSGNPSPQQPPISHSPGPGPGPRQMPPSPQQQFANRPQPPTTPNAHGPDAADLSGGNSNDSCGGPAPGTPNSQSMRPTPSPTGSTGSRSMSPAVGQNIPMPPRPSSGQSDGGAPPPGRISQSPMPPAVSGYGPPSGPQQPPYQGQPYPQPHGGYPPRPQGNYPTQGYGSTPGGQPPVTNNIPSQQFTGRTGPPNHMQGAQFPYQHGWQGSGQKGGPGLQNPSAPNSQNPNLRPPHYLKHHLQHKLSFGNVAPGSAPPSPGPPQNFHMGPPPSGMAPPSAMGPPSSSPLLPNSHPHEGPMPPPSSTPNSHMQMSSEMAENSTNHVSGAPAGSVTSIVTTGPDGAPLDEGSQQSTLSNASAASGEDPIGPQTPKSGRKAEMGHYGPPPQGGPIPSPGSASMNSMHEEYNEISSPSSWPRTPASPVFNSHVPPQDTYRSKKTDSLGKLYEMDDNPDRRSWLDKLLAFMDDRRSPITTCPTISKNPLDLFRLYMYVKDRGGFLEVTKNKTWKDIAGLLGIGASSSAAYTLRKHYTKNLLPYECQFDRGGIDPQPIINQVEATSKKKGNKQTSVPSPGSSNSQDSFPPGGGMDGYVGYNGYPTNDYPQRPSSQSAPSPHGGSGGGNHMNSVPPGGPSPADNVSVSNPFDDVAPSPPPRGGPFPGPPYQGGAPPRGPAGQNYSGQQGYQGYPGPGSGPPDQYPPYSGTQGDSSNNSGNQANNGPAAAPDPYGNRYSGNQPGSYGNRPPYGNTQAPAGTQSTGSYPGHQDYYRNDQNQSGAGYPGMTNKNMPPPSPQPPRRHPDFAKDQPFPPYGQPRQPMYGGWPNNNQYRPPQYGTPQTPGQQWQQGVRNGGQWPPGQNYQGAQPGQQWQPMAAQGQGPNSAMRPVHRPGKPFPNVLPPGSQIKGSNNQPMNTSYGHGQLTKREITFPPDSVENVTPVLYRRKRICRTDVGPVDAWRLLMCLRSGLLTESTYALDMLNILLFDDSSVGYFGLNHWPGLLDLLLEQFKKNLSDMFDSPYPKEQKHEEIEPDLGSVTKPVESTFRTLVLNRTKNYSLMSRKGEPVKHVDRPEDIFITGDTKDWDVRGDANIATIKSEQPTDPWSTNADHILPNFQAEFGNIPFHMTLKDKTEEKIEVKKENSEAQPVSETSLPKSTEKKRTRAKTLSDVISRIKKDSEEGEKNSVLPESITTTTSTLKVKTENLEGESVDLNVNLNGDCGKSSISSGSVKRRRLSDYEDESYTRDEASLVLLTESHDNLGKRCLCLSNILRSLTFIPGNELEFARSLGFLALVGKVLLLHHEHPARTQKTRNYDREEDTDFADSCSSLQGEGEWWWDFLTQIRENILVCLSNIAGQIDISLYNEEVARPVLDGLLHWAICPSATAQDPFTSAGPSSLLSPQRLALEALCKLCVTNCNVDLVIATPPFSRLEKLCAVLTKHLCRSEDQVLREFSINLLHYLAAADSSMARVVALQSPCISLLVAFIEQAEQTASEVAHVRGIGALRDNPDSMGTSLDMLRRAAATLVFLSRHPDNKPLMMQQESRLLALVMSQILDQQVALLISKVLFQISRS